MIDGGMRQLFFRGLPDFDWVAVETGSTSVGAPDSNFCRAGVEGWLELKKTTGQTVKFRPLQPGWIVRRIAHGGLVRIAVRQETLDTDRLWVFDGADVARIVTEGLRGASAYALLQQDGGPKKWDWALAREALLRRG